MKGKRAKVYCEVTCCHCGGLAYGSQYYENATTISNLKEKTKDWIWSDEFCGNLCPECQEELKKKPEQTQTPEVFDRWNAIHEQR